MSSMQRSTGTSTSEPSTAKKKFGKNLNKQLTKPPAPPIATSSRQNSSSRNGLLLLSTKRSSSGGASSLSSGGLLSGKSTLQSRNADSTGTSAHDALLSAAVGASRGDTSQLSSVQQPDAWGVAEKQQATTTSSTATETVQPALAPKGGVSSGYHQSNSNPSSSSEEPRNRASENFSPPSRFERRPRYSDGTTPSNLEQEASGGEDEQLAYMSRLARERSERRRVEEDARVREQKERASRRLKDLEGKMMPPDSDRNGSRGVHSPPAVPLTITARNPAGDGGINHAPNSPVVLERLGRTKTGKDSDGYGGRGSSSNAPMSDRGTQRTLFDPNRTYSSLVGGNSSQKTDRRGAGDEKSSQPDSAQPTDTHSYSRSRDGSFDNSNEESSPYPLIHLSSYEDRDRGERNSSAGPRMLFDPKSGAMVAAPSREEGMSGGKGGRKERARPKGRGGRDRDSKDRDGAGNNDVSLLKPSRKMKGRREDRKSADTLSSPYKEESKKGRNRARGNRPAMELKRLPRTCGVLYVRDEKGYCVCADGLEGDQGYGAHSVPGGRARNPDAHALFLEEEQQQFPQQNAGMFDLPGNASYGPGASYLNGVGQYQTSGHNAGVGKAGTNGTFGPSTIPSTPLATQKVDWVKPNEKIELVTGVDDSPTLQATANPWAPSEAALAAAAAAKDSTKKSDPADVAVDTLKPQTIDTGEAQNDDEAPSFIGLGFDPTANMDSVMRSPTNLNSDLTKKFDPVDLSTLSLNADGDAASRNIFAFGSPTWGSSGAGRLSSWTVPESTFGTSNVQSADGSDNPSGGTSFLSLTSLSVNQESSTWGTSGLTGLGGAALQSAHATDGGAAD